MSPEQRAARSGSDERTHVLMPSMSYACGGNITTKKGCGSTSWVGDWEQVTCPDCRTLDPRELWRASMRQQGHDADTCACSRCRAARKVFDDVEPVDLLDLLL